MDSNVIISFIQNFGFAAACCAALFYCWQNETKQHKNEIDKLTEVIENNTLALSEIRTILNMEREDNKNEK